MMQTIDRESLRLSRVLPARRETVFKAWSTAEHVSQWFSPDGFSVTDAGVEMRPGGAFELCMRATGWAHWLRGTFIEVTPFRRLVIEMSVAGQDGETLFRARTEVDFSDVPDGTRMDVVQTYTLIDLTVAARMVGGAAEGWRTTLDKLARHVAHIDVDADITNGEGGETT